MASAWIRADLEMSVTNLPGNYGNGNDDHAPVGWYTTGWRYRQLVKWNNISTYLPVGAKIVSAKVRFKTTTSTAHVAKGSNVRLKISYLKEAFDRTIGSSEYWEASGGTTGFLSSSTALTYPAEGQHKHNTLYDYDITDFVEFWLPANYLKRNGSPCSNGANHGIEVKSYDEGSSSRSTEFRTVRGGYAPYLIIEYTTEADPSKPTITDPTDGDKATAPTSVSVDWASGTGDEGRLFIGTTDADASVWDSGWNACTPGATQVFDISGASLPVGQTLFIEARSRNDLGVVASSSSVQVYILPIPSVSIVHPGSGGRCHIHNLGDAEVWTSGGAHAQPRVEVQYFHPTGVAAQAIEVSVDDGATWHTFPGVASGETAECDVPQAVYRATDFVIKARATGGGGQDASEVSVTARVNFGQVVLPFDPGPSNSNWVSAHASLAGGARAQRALAYRVSGGSWVRTVGELPDDLATGEMLVRLATSDAAQPPSQPDLTLQYQSTPPPAPDFWEAVNADISLDGQLRRFGVHSLKVVCNFADQYSVRVRNTQPLEVSGSTQYTFSVYVNTLGSLPGALYLAYEDHSNGGALQTLVTGNEDTYSTTDSTGKGKENWQRLYATFTTGPDTTLIKPILIGQPALGDDTQFRMDSAQLESGGVAASWRPGTLGPAVILDVGGIAIDGKAGGIFRARGSGGEVVTLGANGLEVDGEPYITAAEVPTPVAPVRRVYGAGSHTWTKPAGLLYAVVEVLGAGGGGGGAIGHASNRTAGSGGGGGGYAKSTFAASALPASCAISVASGGAGAPAGQNNGSGGGTSTFSGTGLTTMTGEGGGAGEGAGTALNQFHAGGEGAVASGGTDLNWKGGEGETTIAANGRATVGRGGDAGNGAAGAGAPATWHGGNAPHPGAGGSGGANADSTSGVNRSGGNGGDGEVVVTEYYQ